MGKIIPKTSEQIVYWSDGIDENQFYAGSPYSFSVFFPLYFNNIRNSISSRLLLLLPAIFYELQPRKIL